MPSASHTIDIDAAPSVVMATITDFESYPRFLPEMKSVEIRAQSDGQWEATFTLSLIRELTYTLSLTRQSDTDLSWSLVEGAFQENDGGWHLAPLDGGRRTRANYRVSIETGMFLPGSIVRGLVEDSLPSTLERFKAEAEQRAARS